jgi:hypothetical protein
VELFQWLEVTPTNNRFYFPSLRHRAWLYDFVFAGRISLLVVLVLLLSFFVQPVHKSFAQTPEPEPVASEVAPQEPSEQDLTNESELEEEAQAGIEEDLSLEDILDLNSTESIEIEQSVELSNEVSTSSELGDTDEAEIEENASESSESYVEVDSELELTDEEEGELNDVLDGFEATGEVRDHSEYLVTEENYYQFSRQSCVAVGDGSYHCTVKESNPADENAVVYADGDENGIRQIFLRTSKGSTKMITETEFENSSPHYSPEARQVVWQRLIDGRYQVVVYDIDADKERQLTFSKNNNMEPKVSKDGIAWQAWDGNDWEIMFFDGTYTEQITDNELEDVAPVIEDEYILWTVLGGEEQEARVYSIVGGQTMTISSQAGGSIANPRFVLVYDTRFENGDVITQGFDPTTGLSEPLGAEPGPEPIEIPNTDPLGEVRALVSGKAPQDDELDSVLQTDQSTSSDTLLVSHATSTSTLDLGGDTDADLGEALDLGTEIDLEPNFELTEYDLVLPSVNIDEIE